MKTLENKPLVLHLRPPLDMDEEQFFEFCRMNRDWRIERTAEGDIEIMPPTGGETGIRNAAITAQLWVWAMQDGTGVVTDSSGGFYLPNGAMRAPDAAWVRRERLRELTAEQRERFLPLCPDFVVELRSPSDSLSAVQEKMEEYVGNGAQLGWLLDAPDGCCYVYRPGSEAERLEGVAGLSGEPELPGFSLDLDPVWKAGM